MHGHVHARKMRCQKHRTTRTPPLIDVAGDFFGFAHVPRASPLQPRAVSACPPPPVHSASICHLVLYTVHSFASPRTFSIVVFRKMWFGGGPIDAAGALRGFVREAGGCAVVDGGLGTELEAHGADLHDALWSAKCLASAPHLIRKVKHQPTTARESAKTTTRWLLSQLTSDFVPGKKSTGPSGLPRSRRGRHNLCVLPGARVDRGRHALHALSGIVLVSLFAHARGFDLTCGPYHNVTAMGRRWRMHAGHDRGVPVEGLLAGRERGAAAA
jgi:hypothetical protein